MSSVIFKGADALVKKGVYSSKNELIEDALRTFFEYRTCISELLVTMTKDLSQKPTYRACCMFIR
jgi:Arc/MetJ-type ribon-helix-helix transcriptional regulator